MTDPSVHTAFGVYAVCVENDKLLVIHKSRGPYVHRYDLPGGNPEAGESLATALRREFLEETGMTVRLRRNIGTADVKLPWHFGQTASLHHIAAFYEGERASVPAQAPAVFEEQDALGTAWVSAEHVSTANASPLVLLACAWLKKRELPLETFTYETWEVLPRPDAYL
ncbi:NUDIX hydrolase [Alkalicoccus chagannorensis]|uniref:NUDIX hydrolase n=1 Tax=Alkalicoccus chagannorensis TaxID=427072 RepID=UPI000405E0F7|nr:NUDIX hydrolase [Alkalicoccus chagannorensis]